MPHWIEHLQHDREAKASFVAEMHSDLLGAMGRMDKAVQHGDLAGAATALGAKQHIAELIHRATQGEIAAEGIAHV